MPHFTEPDPSPPTVLGSAVPLTKEALGLLNGNTGETSRSLSSNTSESGTTEAEGSINAYNPDYRNALEARDVHFAEKTDTPPDFDELRQAMLLPGNGSEPNDIEAENLRAQLDDANNESAVLKEILPRIVPLKLIQLKYDTACIKEQLWRREICVRPDMKPALTTPKPHLTIGWRPEAFESNFRKAYKSLKAFISPAAGYRNVAWPIFTIEIGGDGVTVGVVGLQNLHNGAVLLSNLFELKRLCGDEAAFVDKIHVIGVKLTAESIRLSCYWAFRNDLGGVE